MKEESVSVSGSACVEGDRSRTTNCKRFKTTTHVNGFIVYTRRTKNTNVDIPVESPKERLVTEKLKEVDTESGSLVDVVIDDIDFVEMLHEAVPVEVLLDGSLDFEVGRVGNSVGAVRKPFKVSEENRDRPFKRTAEVYKSVLRMKKVNNIVPEDEEETDSVGFVGKSDLVSKRPQTVRELFDTGILDGVPVVYMGTFKSQAFGLRGIIKDGGILCSCSFCDWAQVVTTSMFEIHACKQYRRASQYICFENGKSLLDVLKICRNAPLHSIVPKVLDAVGCTSKEKIYTCKRCKGVFPLSSLGHRGFLCSSCSDVYNSEPSHAATRTLKIIRNSSESTSKSHFFMSPHRNSSQKMNRKWLSQHSATPKALKSVSFPVSFKKSKILRKEQLHKLVFEKGGLPDGTELGYYARGKKLVGGYKMGAGIFCYCCKCEAGNILLMKMTTCVLFVLMVEILCSVIAALEPST